MKVKLADHALKCWPEFFQPIIDKQKLFEIRSTDDRDFKVGQILLLREWKQAKNGDPRCAVHVHIEPDGRCTCGKVGRYTGRSCRVRVLFITGFEQRFSQVVMSIKLLKT